MYACTLALWVKIEAYAKKLFTCSFCRYIRPQFFFNNPLLSFIQFVIGPYTDDLGNVLPYAVEGVGVPVDPLAFAGLLGDCILYLWFLTKCCIF